MRRVLVAGCVVLSGLAASAAAEEESSPLVQNALEFVARASSTSEVLTLNLTNLLILLVLKAFIFGFGLFASGAAGGLGRSADGGSSTTVTETEMSGAMCFLLYTSGVESKLACLERAACEDPYSAKDYLTAAKMWYKMHKILGSSLIPFEDRYAKIMHAVDAAVEYAVTGAECSKKYSWF